MAMKRFKTYEELTIRDNFLFQKVMRNKRLCKRLIERILGIKIYKISYPSTEKSIAVRYDSKSVRLDVYVEDEEGTLYDIEMQTSDVGSDGELPKRTRYYQSMMDLDILDKGEWYSKLRKTYIIFICTFDPFDRNRSVYTFRETCQEDKSLLMGDETTKIFLNSKGGREGLHPDVAAFLDYVDGKAAKGKLTQDIATEVAIIKEHKETKVEYMTLLMEMKRQREEGREAGKNEARLEFALDMLKDKMPLKKVVKLSKLSLEQVKELAKKNHLATE